MSSTPPAPPAQRTPGTGARIWGTVVVMVGAIFAATFVYMAGDALGAADDTVDAVAGLAFGGAILGFTLVLRNLLPGHERRLATLSKRSLGVSLAIGLGIGLAFRFGVGLLAAIGQEIDPSQCRRYAEAADIIPPEMWQRIVLAFALVVLAPLGEELLFRGILLRGLVRAMPFAPAALISGIAFGAVHLQYWEAWPLLLGVGVLGVANAFVYRRWGFAAAVATHAVFNAIAAVFLFVELDPPDADECAE